MSLRLLGCIGKFYRENQALKKQIEEKDIALAETNRLLNETLVEKFRLNQKIKLYEKTNYRNY